MFQSFSLRPMLIASTLVLALTQAGSEARADTSVPGEAIQLNPCLASLPLAAGGANLVPCSLRFNSMGEIHFSFKNRGAAAINTVQLAPGESRPKSAQPSGPPIRIDVYLQNNRIASLDHAALAAGAVKEITLKIPSNYPTPKCGEVRALKLVLDPQNKIAEMDDGDNMVERPSANRPCPDVTIDSITKNANAAHTEFVAEIKLANIGNAPARFRYLVATSSSASFGPLPDLDSDVLMELEPGQSKKFTAGNAWGMSKMYVWVLVDRMNEIPELNEGNNSKETTLD